MKGAVVLVPEGEGGALIPAGGGEALHALEPVADPGPGQVVRAHDRLGEEPGKVVDLMAALEASLARAGSPDGGATAEEAEKPARKRQTRSRKSA